LSQYKILKRNRYFEVLGALNVDNRSDNKVGMVIDIDLSNIEKKRKESNALEGLRPSYTAFLLKAIALTLKEQSHANQIAIEWPFYKRIVQLMTTDISVAVEKDIPGFEQAVYVATVRNAERKTLLEITKELQFFTMSSEDGDKRWKQMKMIVEKIPFVWLAKFIIKLPKYFPSLWIEHRGGAAMISSPAKYGVDTMMATWPWPLGFSFGLVKDRVMVINGKAEVRKTMFVTFSFDRRLMGGAPAARFFRAVCDKLENESNAVSEVKLQPTKKIEREF
jgi:pyruvate/2-oxoglutarate dehydrogenase complex dihydrolipoamide acyltransferase (E2) component